MDLRKIKRLLDWQEARPAIERAVLDMLGELPRERVELQVKVIDEFQHPGYVRRQVNYFVSEWERISAWLFVPEGREEVPGLLCCHQTVAQGKNEPAGIEGNSMLAFAQRYAEIGYVTIAPDCITAGERVSPGLEPFDTSSYYKDNPRGSAMGKMLWDHQHAVDVLMDTKRVDSGRIGVIGHSLGAYNALFLTAFDERIQACVASCGFTRFADDANPERWARDDWFCHMPKLRKAIETGTFPFDWEHVLALAAPTPVLVTTALDDEVFSNPASCEEAVKQAKRIYELLGADNALDWLPYAGGHGVTAESLERADDWFERWL